MTTQLKWGAPPATQTSGPQAKWQQEADELRSRPGEWAILSTSPSRSMATFLKKGRMRAFEPPGAFEATSRQRPDGKFDIYVRFVGTAE